MTQNAVVEKKDNSVALSDDYLSLVQQDSGAGCESMTVEDFAIPRIGIVQSLSPQRSKTKTEYIEGCTEGNIFESVTKKLWDGEKGIKVVPVKYSRSYLEWKDRDEGGGLVKNHGSDRTAYDSARVDAKNGKHYTPEGNVVVPTAEYYVLVLDNNGVPLRAVISMSSTFMKQAKAWNNLINQSKVKGKDGNYLDTPMFFNVYNLSTVPVSNDSGDWFTWKVEVDQNVFSFAGNRSLYDTAKEFLKGIEAGSVKVAEASADAVEESEDDPM